jgi:DNA-directed RNA polymerase specialized sigma24 family protein
MGEYERDEPVEDEIADLPEIGSTALYQHLSTRGASLAPETLVYVMRAAAAAHRTDTFEEAGRLLFGLRDEDGNVNGGHCEGILRVVARKRFFVDDAALYLDFAQRVCDLALREIRAGWEEKPFWEVNFRAALFRRALQVAKSVRRAQLRDLSVPFEEEHLAGVDAEETERSILGEVSRQILLEVIEGIPPRQREAATLAWIVGYPKAGSGDSVASVMSISETAVHNLLTKARGRLMNDPRVRAMVEDRESA